MDTLFSGLVGSLPDSESAKEEQHEPSVVPSATSKEVNTPRPGRPSGKKKETISTVVDVEVMKKVRAIAKKEDISIAAVIEVGLHMAIQNYEEKNGPIRTRVSKKKELGDVFNL